MSAETMKGRVELDGTREVLEQLRLQLAAEALTVSESLRAQGRSILDFLVESVRSRLARAPGPSLLPVSP